MVLANRMSPALGLVFAAVIFVDVYTSAVPLLRTGVKRAAAEYTRRCRVMAGGGGPGCVIACIVPYTLLLNVLYGLNGYLFRTDGVHGGTRREDAAEGAQE